MINKLSWLFALALLLACQLDAKCQTGPSLNIVNPPPPDVSALTKFGQVPVSNFTGIPNISVPIYTINEGTVAFPISIQYHAGGIKVKEDASEVGLGWALSAGGSITAITRGRPDFQGGFADTYVDMPDAPTTILSTSRQPITSIDQWYYAWGSDSHQFTSSNYSGILFSGLNLPHANTAKEYFNYFEVGNEGTAPDFASDLYVLNFGNRSCKFIFDNNFKPTVLGDGALKIELIPNGTYPDWKVTDESGTIYYFTQRQFSYSNSVDPALTTGTASSLSTWHLTKIRSATYGEINFNYLYSTQSFVHPLPSISETYRVGNSSPNIQQNFELVTPHFTMYHQLNIDNIQFSSGYVKFLYDDQRADLQGGRRLFSVEVRDKENRLVKKTNLDNNDYFIANQGYYSGIPEINFVVNSLTNYTSDNHNKRLKLKGTSEINLVSNEVDSKYIFTYNEQLNLPGKLSLAVDHWGFFNGAQNQQLVPPATITLPSQATEFLPGANRNANPAFSQANILTSIQYPTGVKVGFSYANNQYTRQETVIHYSDETSSLFKDDASSVVNSSGFVDANGNFTAATAWNGKKLKIYCLVYRDNNLYPLGTYFLDIVIKKDGNFLKRINTLSGTAVQDSSIVIQGGSSYNISFDPTTVDFFNSCEIRRTVYVPKASSTSSLEMVTRYLGGLRVGNISTLDPITLKSTNRKYTYLDGTADDIPIYVSPVGHDYYSIVSGGTPVYYDNPFRYRYGQSIYEFSDGRDAPYFGYGRVQISDLDADNIPNGMTEYYYNNSGSINVNTMLYYSNQIGLDVVNPIITPIPAITRGRGDLLEERYFKWTNNVMAPISRDQYIYTANNSTKVWQMLFDQGLAAPIGGGYNSERYFKINAHHFAIPVNRNTLDRKDHYQYDNLGNESLTFSEKYTYDVVNGHFQMIAKSVTASNGDTNNLYYKFPQDYTGLQDQSNLDGIAMGILNLQNRHIVIPVESYKEIIPVRTPNTRKYVGGLLNTFNQVLPTLNQVMAIESQSPMNSFSFSTIVNGQFLKDPRYTTRVRFTNYDEKGRLLQQSLEQNYSTAYKWGYDQQFLIAEIANSSVGDVFLENFEEGNGNGSIDNSKTGHHSFTGSYSKNLVSLSNGDYILSYWMKSGIDWILTEQNVVVTNGSYSINLGSGQYDDIRFFPKSAQMTTYTYDPLIGLTSQSDANNKVTYYEYDSLMRLKLMRDEKRNIIKEFEYKYWQSK
ncbi:hypothetical protein [Chryseolinea lacunae]|uniref:YD repeat-containing protein n=1 Tax=Chryseolinea lacunae TaxID=2801331 RepID=A0ABS1KPW4_9BACT|nr:hypothetical protein [Chryseolinea lacunae]MBL0741394.1 hypothetical protein [Chryseolinea lacunae]